MSVSVVNKNRVLFLDVARAISVIWIVGILHVIGYVMDPSLLPTWIIRLIEGLTITCLSTFTFLSGYFVCRRPFTCKKDVFIFFKKRFQRFVLLYLIACVTLYLAGIILNQDTKWFHSWQQLIATLIGVSGLIPGYQPATFWYFSMIILFYLFTPVIGFQTSKQSQLFIMGIIGVTLFCETIYTGADVRLPFYYIFYCLGALWNGKLYCHKKLWFFVIALIALSLAINLNDYLSIQNFLVGTVGVVLILGYSNKLTYPALVSLFSFIAYASMCTYLYHRHIFSFVKLLYHGNYWPVILWPFVVIITFVIGYAIQYYYDYVLNRKK